MVANHEGGQVAVVFDINPNGTTGNVQIESSTSDELSEVAIQAVSQWVFSPAVLNGIPVRLRVRQIFPFNPSRK